MFLHKLETHIKEIIYVVASYTPDWTDCSMVGEWKKL